MLNTLPTFDNINDSFIDNDKDDNYFFNHVNKEKNINSIIFPFYNNISDFNKKNESFNNFKIDLDDFSKAFSNNLLYKNNKEEKNNIFLINNNLSKENNNKFVIKKSPKIFNIQKVIKLGRPKKHSLKRRKHDKFKLDNVIRKFKVKLTQNIYNYINISFTCNQYYVKMNKSFINIIQKINSKETKSISKIDNIRWLNTKIKDIFSQKVSSKFIIFEPNYNKKLIKKILEQKKEIKVIEVLEKTVRDMWIIYKNDDIYHEFPGFQTIKYDIEKFKEMNESEDYIGLYRYACNKFEDIFKKIRQRRKKISIK